MTFTSESGSAASSCLVAAHEQVQFWRSVLGLTLPPPLRDSQSGFERLYRHDHSPLPAESVALS